MSRGSLRAALLALTAFACLGAGPFDERIDFFYVEPNVGTAAAGHTAIAFGDRVYHYQNAGGSLLQAARTRADSFRYGYSVLENRTIRAARIAVDAQTYGLLRREFEERYQTERHEFDLADGLRADRELAEWLLSEPRSAAPTVGLPGAGYFFPARAGSDGSLASLRARVAAERGKVFLSERLNSLDTEIRGLRPSDAPFAQRYAELSLEQLAVRALLHALPLHEERVRTLPASAGPLQPQELTLLARYAEALEERVLALLDSNRPDRGRPLLVALARRAAVERSLARGRLVVLDSFPQDALVVDGDALRARGVFLAELHDYARPQLDAARMAVVRDGVLDERAYQWLEESANRFLEYDEALGSRDAVRMRASALVPSAQPEPTPLPIPEVPAAELAPAIETLRADERRQAERLASLYGYSLITRNCATEIFALIDDALGTEGSRARLGGHVEAGSALHFVPARAFAAVRSHYRIVETGEIPSLRRARLDEMYASESPLWVYLRESNTLTSSVYRRNDRDSAFLFFTEDAVAPRPLLGVFNLLAGLVEAASGLLRLPFDGGESLVAGGKGALFSVPELFFFNIRKGTLEYARTGEPRTRLRSSEALE